MAFDVLLQLKSPRKQLRVQNGKKLQVYSEPYPDKLSAINYFRKELHHRVRNIHLLTW